MRMITWVLIATGLAGPSVAQEDMRPVPRPGETVESVEVPVPDGGGLTLLPNDTVPAPRPEDLLVGHEFRLALGAAGQGNWDLAAALAVPGGPVASSLIEWRRLRSGIGSFDDYRAFLASHPDWPGLGFLRRRGERAIPLRADPEIITGYFERAAPQTGQGALRLAMAWRALDQDARAAAVISAAWTTLEMSAAEEAAILLNFSDTLKPLHEARLNALLWAQDRDGALRMRALVGEDWKALADARLALQREAKGVDALIGKVPDALQDDGGLIFDRVVWRIENRRRNEAMDLIVEASTSAKALGEPAEWANWRRVLARQAMRNGDGAKAYALASKHFMAHTTEDYAYADLEWLSGYLALRYLDDPEQALIHFQRFTAAVYTPISLGRAHYWQGRAFEALGDTEAAAAAYAEGGTHQTSFYGLLAAEKAGLPMDPALIGDVAAAPWEGSMLASGSALQAAFLNYRAGQRWEAIRFFSHLADTLPEADLPTLAAAAQSLGDAYVSVRVAKRIVRRGIVVMPAYFPVVDLGIELPVEPALALSIARRESEFDIAAVSPVGARGLMQLMPGTAQGMSRKLGLDYRASALTTDGVYNATLGSAYLDELIDEFGENYALVAAGYNAGPGRPRSWIGLYGDPRARNIDAVDWVEHIPFRETRNYVMRVMESVPIYRARLTGEVAPIDLSAALKAR